jgi:alpha/beta hydrolase family protein
VGRLRRLRFRFLAVVVCAFVAGGGLALARAATPAVPSPTVTGPVVGGLRGHALFDSWFNLADIGYTQAEYFVSGTAKDAAGNTAPYTTRIIVTRPSNPKRFNGTVLLDWANVTAQFENAVDTLEAHRMLTREGFAVVHASVQSAGICCTPLTPKVWDPVRYAPLSHPGDAYANDIFSQLAKGIRSPRGVNPMGTLKVTKVVAAGQSQSASKLDTYVRNVQAGARVIDGFLIHGGGSKAWATPPAAPVLHLLSDEEASPAAPNATKNYRLWEIAGTAHSDFWLGYQQVFGSGPRVLADAPQKPAAADDELSVVAGNYGEMVHPMHATCILAGATMPMRYAVSTAIHDLDLWVRGGGPPANGPRFQFDGGQLAKDQYQNTRGGIRYPPIDVPVATYLSTTCGLGGITVPFSDSQLHTLYPTHAAYYKQMKAATSASVRAGWLLRPDATDLLTRACAAKVRWGESGACS